MSPQVLVVIILLLQAVLFFHWARQSLVRRWDLPVLCWAAALLLFLGWLLLTVLTPANWSRLALELSVAILPVVAAACMVGGMRLLFDIPVTKRLLGSLTALLVASAIAEFLGHPIADLVSGALLLWSGGILLRSGQRFMRAERLWPIAVGICVLAGLVVSHAIWADWAPPRTVGPMHWLVGLVLTWVTVDLITFFHQRERATLASQQRRYHHLFEHARDAIVLFEPESRRIVDVNARACELLGLPREVLIGKDAAEFVAGLEEPSHGPLDETGTAIGLVEAGLLWVRRADGTAIPVSVTSGLVEAGGTTFRYAIAHDMSRRLEQERALQARTRELSILLETARLAAASTHPEDLAIDVLERVVNLFGADAGAVFLRDDEGQVLRMLAHYGHPPEFVRAFETIPLANSDSLHVQVVESGQPIMVDDVPQRSGIIPPELQELAPRSALIAPLMARGYPVGTIAVGFLQPRSLDSASLNLLAAVGQQVGIAVKNAFLFARAKERLQDLSVLIEFSLQIASAGSLEQTARRALHFIASWMNVRQAALFIWESERERLILVETVAIAAPSTDALRRWGAQHGGTLRRLTASGRVLKFADIYSDPLHSADVGLDWRSVSYLPLTTADRWVGAVMLPALPAGSSSELLLLTMADLAAVALERARLESAARRRADRLAAIGRLVQELNAERDLGTLLRTIVCSTQRLLACDLAVLFMYKEPARELTASATSGDWDRIGHPQREALRQLALEAISSGQSFERTFPEPSAQGDESSACQAVVVPLRHRSHALGALVAVRHQEMEPFSHDEADLLSLFANHSAIAIENAGLLDTSQRYARQLEAVGRATSQLTQELDMPQLLTQILDHLAEVVEHDNSAVVLFLDGKGQVAAARGYPDSRELVGQPVELENRRQVWEEGRVISRVGPCRDVDEVLACKVGVCASLEVPLRVRGALLGILRVARHGEHRFSPQEQDLIELFSNHVAVAINNARMYAELQRYSEQLEEEVARRTAELEMALEQAQEADRLKTIFLSTVSHELRTPLAAIKGFASTLLQDDVTWPPEVQREFLSVIDRESDHLGELIGQLLDVSRLETGMLRIEQMACRLVDVVDSIRNRLSVLCQDHLLRVEIPQDLPMVFVDVQRVGQVLTNLVDNAVKQAPSGSTITIRAESGGDHVIVSVIDEGPGIPEEFRDRVFEPFFRIDGNTSGGSGLGLAICRGIIQAHGGQIWVEDAPGQGSCLKFTVPAVQ